MLLSKQLGLMVPRFSSTMIVILILQAEIKEILISLMNILRILII
uniref:Uncharacterized protein n=1 Tax=Rhodnius prolixus TaxID=13249 RepID=T1HEH1_RHOPR